MLRKSRVPDLVLRVVLGITLLTSAFLKVRAIDDHAFRASLSWRLVGGTPVGMIIACHIEAAFGCALIAGVWIRPLVVASIAALVFVSAAHLLFARQGHPIQSCGCFGTPQLEAAIGVPLLVRNAVLVFAYAALLIPVKESTRGGGGEGEPERSGR